MFACSSLDPSDRKIKPFLTDPSKRDHAAARANTARFGKEGGGVVIAHSVKRYGETRDGKSALRRYPKTNTGSGGLDISC